MVAVAKEPLSIARKDLEWVDPNQHWYQDVDVRKN